jgi:hypothetical protein
MTSNPSILISVDPMADQRSWVSPYSYCQNNPVGRVDPTGELDIKNTDWWIYNIESGKIQRFNNLGGKDYQIITFVNNDGIDKGIRIAEGDKAYFTHYGNGKYTWTNYDIESRQVNSNSDNKVDWGTVTKGIGTTIGGIYSTTQGVQLCVTGVGTLLGGSLITFGVPTVGFGLAQIIDGFDGGNRNIPSGIGEAIDVSIGGTGEFGQWFDIVSGGSPSSMTNGLFLGFTVANSNTFERMKYHENKSSVVKAKFNYILKSQ